MRKNLNAHYILTKEYIEDYQDKSRWEVRESIRFNPVIRDLEKSEYTIMRKPEEMLELEETIPSKVLRCTVDGCFKEQIEILEKVIKSKKIKAGITWVNNNCLKRILRENNIPTIHHELGPLRAPQYIPTVYLDFSGVNGSTEFDERFKEFLKISNEVPILNREQLLKIVSPNNCKELIEVLHETRRTHDIGVGLQVEVDTNVLLFNKGISWVDPLLAAESSSKTKVLVRPHPLAHYEMKTTANVNIDNPTKTTSIDFINRCNKIYCLNSSVAFEALLLGREAKIFGDNPFYNLCYMDEDTLLKALNFTIFGYLVHRELLFDEDYYEFRLDNRGNEKLIYLDNMKRLISKVNK